MCFSSISQIDFSTQTEATLFSRAFKGMFWRVNYGQAYISPIEDEPAFLVYFDMPSLASNERFQNALTQLISVYKPAKLTSHLIEL